MGFDRERVNNMIDATRISVFWYGLLFLMATSVSLLGCVSVSVGGKKASRSENVSFSSPSSPFSKIDLTNADAAWQNRSNGNLISFFSACDEAGEPSLEGMQRDLWASLDAVEVIETHEFQFNGRQALRALVAGPVDGVRTKIDSVVFKRNNCSYSLSYVGVEKNFEEQRQEFNRFLEGFRAP